MQVRVGKVSINIIIDVQLTVFVLLFRTKAGVTRSSFVVTVILTSLRLSLTSQSAARHSHSVLSPSLSLCVLMPLLSWFLLI